MRLLTVLLMFLGTNITNREIKNKMADKKAHIQHFLNKISSVESSNGTNMDHPQLQHGIHTGDSAIGRYGLMPNTVMEVLNRMRMNGTMTPELIPLRNMDHNTLKSTLEAHPELEDKIANVLANKVIDNQPNDDMAAYSWHQGHNLTPEKIQQAQYENNDYVKKFKDAKDSNWNDENLGDNEE